MRTLCLSILVLAACEASPQPRTAATAPPARVDEARTTPRIDAGITLGDAPVDASPPDAPTPDPGAAARAGNPLDLDWTLVRAGDHLHLEYSVHNASAISVSLLDHLLVDGERHDAFDRAVVRNGAKPGMVEFVRGFAQLENVGRGIAMIYHPAMRRLEPGATATGAADIPLPLTAWHNFGWAVTLKGTPQTATLLIGYLTDWDSWASVSLDDGTTVTVPQPGYLPRQQFVRSAPRAIP